MSNLLLSQPCIDDVVRCSTELRRFSPFPCRAPYDLLAQRDILPWHSGVLMSGVQLEIALNRSTSLKPCAAISSQAILLQFDLYNKINAHAVSVFDKKEKGKLPQPDVARGHHHQVDVTFKTFGKGPELIQHLFVEQHLTIGPA